MSQLVGAVLTVGVYTLLLLVNVGVTLRHIPHPSSSIAQVKNHMHTGIGIKILGQVVAMFMGAMMAVVFRAIFDFPWLVSGFLGLCCWVAISATKKSWTRIVTGVAFIALTAFADGDNGYLAVQAFVLAFLLSACGMGSLLPVRLGNTHTGVPRYGVVGIPLWLMLLVGATVLDVALHLDDAATYRVIGELLAFSHETAGVQAVGADWWARARFLDQDFGLGFYTSIVAFMFIGNMAMWAREMDRPSLIWLPLIGWAAGMLAAFGVAATFGSALAAPYVCVGLSAATILAVYRSNLWQLLMTLNPSHYGDESYRLFWGPDPATDSGPIRKRGLPTEGAIAITAQPAELESAQIDTAQD